MEHPASLYDAETELWIGPATPEHIKAVRAFVADGFRPGLILVDDVFDVIAPFCGEADDARAVWVV